MALIINGSPNKQGATMSLFKALFPKIDEAEILHAYDLNIHPCDDCRVCQKKISCQYNDDDFSVIKDTLLQNDTIILISPVYFGSFTDQLLKIINRFQQFFAQKFTHQAPLKHIKHIYVVASCGAKNQEMFDGMALSLKILGSLFEAKTHLFTFTGADQVKNYTQHYQTDIAHYKSQMQ